MNHLCQTDKGISRRCKTIWARCLNYFPLTPLTPEEPNPDSVLGYNPGVFVVPITYLEHPKPWWFLPKWSRNVGNYGIIIMLLLLLSSKVLTELWSNGVRSGFCPRSIETRGPWLFCHRGLPLVNTRVLMSEKHVKKVVVSNMICVFSHSYLGNMWNGSQLSWNDSIEFKLSEHFLNGGLDHDHPHICSFVRP